MGQIIIIMASKGDMGHCTNIATVLDKFDVKYEMRIASAHKVPMKVLDIIKENENDETVFITVAGRSNALSGFVDANTTKPVIASPPYSGKFNGADIFSSLRMPSGVAPVIVLEPEQAALAAVKILALNDSELQMKIVSYQEENRKKLEEADQEIRNG